METLQRFAAEAASLAFKTSREGDYPKAISPRENARNVLHNFIIFQHYFDLTFKFEGNIGVEESSPGLMYRWYHNCNASKFQYFEPVVDPIVAWPDSCRLVRCARWALPPIHRRRRTTDWFCDWN